MGEAAAWLSGYGVQRDYLSTKGSNGRRLRPVLKSLRCLEKLEIRRYLQQEFFGQFMLYFLPIGQDMLYRRME